MPPRPQPQSRTARVADAARASAGRETRRMVRVQRTPGTGPTVKAGPVSAPVIPLLLMAVGGYLLWFGVHYWRSDVAWPSAPLKQFLQGKGLPDNTQDTADIQTELTAAFSAAGAGGGGGSVSPSSAPSASGSGTTLTTAQIEQLWTQQGGPKDTASFAARVAMAESGGRTAVTSSNPDGGTNVGLYQLDTKGVGAGYSVAQLADPVTNTRITIMATHGGTDWRYWGDPVTQSVGYQYTPQLA